MTSKSERIYRMYSHSKEPLKSPSLGNFSGSPLFTFTNVHLKKLPVNMVKKKKKAVKKKRATKYDPKLKIEGTFIDIINAAVKK